MAPVTVLHYVTQWLWLSDSFVFGPISAAHHQPVVVSRMSPLNVHVYPPPKHFHALDGADAVGEVPAEGLETAEVVARLLGSLRPDVVHVHHGYALSDATAIADLLQVPLVVSFWGYDVTALPTVDPYRVKPYLHAPASVLVPSRFLAHRVHALAPRERSFIAACNDASV